MFTPFNLAKANFYGIMYVNYTIYNYLSSLISKATKITLNLDWSYCILLTGERNILLRVLTCVVIRKR